jgi:hypothetical protein
MERLENGQTYQQFAAANLELDEFLKKVDGLAKGAESIAEEDLLFLSKRLATLAPEVEKTPLLETCGEPLPGEIAEYIKNLRALQLALETVRCVMLARKVQLENAKRHLRGVQGWVNAYQQTT